MPRAVTVQTNFTSGEISPRLKGRVDLTKYFNGAQQLKNFIVKPQGGIFARPGTIFCCEVKDSSKTTILIEFEYSDIQSFIIEAGAGYMRFIKDHERLEVASVPVEVSTPYTEDELPYLRFAQSADVLYIAHPAHPTMQLSRLSDTNWSLDAYENEDGPYLPQNATDNTMLVSGVVDRANLANSVAEFAGGDVGNFVEFNQLGVPVIAEVIANIDANNNTVRPIENIIAPVDSTAVVTEAAGVVTSTVAIFSNDNVGSYIKVTGNWYLISGYTDTTHVSVGSALSMVATTGDLILSGRSIIADVLASENTFVASDVGRHMRFNFSTEQVWGIIETYINAKAITISLDRNVPVKQSDPSTLRDDGKTALWRLGAWSASTGYPSTVAFHEERLVFAATPYQPQTFWMSVSGEYSNHAPTNNQSAVLDNSAINGTIASGRVNAIKWLNSGPTLIIGTFGAEWQVRASNQGTAITPTNISVVQHTTYGSGNISPIRIGSAVVFIQRNGRKVRELQYDYQSDSLQAKDMTIVNEQIIRKGGKTTSMAYQQEPNSIVWVALTDGTLAGMTYVKDQEVYAWHNHQIGGTYNNGQAQVRSVAVISNLDGNEDELYMIVRRTINGITRQYIEYLSSEVDPTDENDKDNLDFVDCAIPYSGASVSSISGLTHLAGETVQIFADGATRTPTTITLTGTLSFTTAASTIFAGLPYESVVKTFPPEGGNPLGASTSLVKRIDRIAVRIHESMGFKFGPTIDRLDQWSARSGDSPMDSSPPLRTLDVPLKFEGLYKPDGCIIVKRDSPTPLNILAIVTSFDTEVG
jgi:hypothetical protein